MRKYLPGCGSRKEYRKGHCNRCSQAAAAQRSYRNSELLAPLAVSLYTEHRQRLIAYRRLEQRNRMNCLLLKTANAPNTIGIWQTSRRVASRCSLATRHGISNTRVREREASSQATKEVYTQAASAAYQRSEAQSDHPTWPNKLEARLLGRNIWDCCSYIDLGRCQFSSREWDLCENCDADKHVQQCSSTFLEECAASIRLYTATL